MRSGVLLVALLCACGGQPTASTPRPPVAADPAPAIEYLAVLGTLLAKNIPVEIDDDRAVEWSIEGLNLALAFDLEFAPDLTPYGRSCEQAHTQLRGLIRSWLRVSQLVLLDDLEGATKERVNGRALNAEVEEAIYRCERGL